GVALDDRLAGIIAAVQARLTRDVARIGMETVRVDALVRQFRGDARSLADAQRHAVIAADMDKRPGFVGRLIRRVLPFAMLIWFPLVQPLLAAILPTDGGATISVDRWLPAVVHAVSASNVLTGLTVSLLLLAAMVAGVYSWSARDALRAADRLRNAPVEAWSGPSTASIAETVARPVATVRDELASIVGSLEQFSPAAPDAVPGSGTSK
ncbi:MAG: hypothetical protein HOP29_05190, partial [Phycisphaerales bacterium]|nr:hypothetical protein [Phycisphaerales bacterium]